MTLRFRVLYQLLFTCIVLITLQTIAHAEVHYHYYPVKGSTYQALIQSLRLNGPKGHHALTTWHIHWSYAYYTNLSHCRLIEIEVQKQAKVILPRWVNEPKTDSPLRSEWHRYMKALAAHEKQHIQHASHAQKAIKQALYALPMMRGCEEMSKKATQTAHLILAQAIEADEKLDKETKHGKQNGAAFIAPRL